MLTEEDLICLEKAYPNKKYLSVFYIHLLIDEVRTLQNELRKVHEFNELTNGLLNTSSSSEH